MISDLAPQIPNQSELVIFPKNSRRDFLYKIRDHMGPFRSMYLFGFMRFLKYVARAPQFFGDQVVCFEWWPILRLDPPF